ncbi:hypothetical protein GF360_01775 [candidate division WWE3 bacterium]|nr:hypothetical protein [candidate division WWE3 bacterium]
MGKNKKTANINKKLGAIVIVTVAILGIFVIGNKDLSTKLGLKRGWKQYMWEEKQVSLKYPSNWKAVRKEGESEKSKIEFKNEAGETRIELSNTSTGMGCMGAQESMERTFQIGQESVTQKDFCGTEKYYIDAVNPRGYSVKVVINMKSIDSKEEQEIREILKMVKGLTLL